MKRRLPIIRQGQQLKQFQPPAVQEQEPEQRLRSEIVKRIPILMNIAKTVMVNIHDLNS